ncbi:MAG: hypothetical protein WBC71_14010 [Salaquimonas sp.]
MASQFYTPKVRNDGHGSVELGSQPFNRDSTILAFGKYAKQFGRVLDGQDLAGSGALVFEGEVIRLPAWN